MEKSLEIALRLAEDQLRKNEKYRNRLIRLRKKMESKNKGRRAWKRKRVKGTTSLENSKVGECGHDEMDRKLREMEQRLKGKEEEIRKIKRVNQGLIMEAREFFDKLQELRKLVEKDLKINGEAATGPIGLKSVGRIDIEPFYDAIKEKEGHENALERALHHCSLLEKNMANAGWHPFKIMVDDEGRAMCIIDEEDVILKDVLGDYGGKAHAAVVRALEEVNQYKPSGGSSDQVVELQRRKVGDLERSRKCSSSATN